MGIMKVVAAGLLMLGIVGCDSTPAKPDYSRQVTATVDYSRFQIAGSGNGIALDTKTGLLCHTYNERRATYVQPQNGPGLRNLPGNIGHPSYNSLPLCIDLSQDEAATLAKEREANKAFDWNKYPKAQ